MKKLFTLLCTIVCLVTQVKAYDYFVIHFSNGTKSDVFYTSGIDSIRYSQIGLDSIKYADLQVQEIWTPDSIYRYSLSDIDSISFTNVDEEVLARRISHVCATISPYYKKTSSTEDISQYLSEIQSIDGVEDAWTDNQSLFVKVKDSGIITYYYVLDDAERIDASESRDVKLFQKDSRRTASSVITINKDIDVKKVLLFNQESRDQYRETITKYVASIEKWCKDFGLSVNNTYSLSPSFFYNTFYNYDIVLMKTHGHYDGKNHWITTGEQLFVDQGKTVFDASYFVNTYHASKNTAAISFTPEEINFTVIKEKRNGLDSVPVYYTAISDKFFSKTKASFSGNKKNTIIFNTACQSLKGSTLFADVLRKKGAVSYLGYDESNDIGLQAFIIFLQYLLNGSSTNQAFESIPEEWKTQKLEFPKKSKKYITPHLKHVHKNSVGICPPITLPCEDTSTSDTDLYVKLRGKINKLLDLESPYGKKNVYTFWVSENPDMSSPKIYATPLSDLSYDASNRSVEYYYRLSNINLSPSTRYYYCAALYDGDSYRLGEIKSFTTLGGKREAYAISKDSVLTFYYDDKKNSRRGNSYSFSKYLRVSYDNTFSKVVIDESFSDFRPIILEGCFLGCGNLRTIEGISNLNTSQGTSMKEMFSGCNSLQSLDLSSFNTANVTDMKEMFRDCTALQSLNLSSFNTTNVKNMLWMFSNCTSLTNLNVSSFNTSNVTVMSGMFENYKS